MTQQDSDKILFAVWLINALSRAWGMGAPGVYRALRRGDMADGYILRHYDVLHTMGEAALVDEMTELAQKRGVLI